MYVKSAQFYDQLYHFKDYRVASWQLLELVRQHHPAPRTLLDVACSTGRHLDNLHAELNVEGLDISEELLVVARQRLPGITFHRADMTDFDLGRRYDVVTCLFSSIAYSRTVAKLESAIASMARHLEPTGLLLVEPWLTPEQYWRNNIVMNVSEQPGLKICWMYVGTEEDGLVTNDIHFMVGTPDGVSQFNEVHYMGLFTHADYLQAIARAGLELLTYDAKGFFGNGLYLARRV